MKMCLREIYGQGRPRSAYGSAQSDQDIHCPFKVSLDTAEYTDFISTVFFILIVQHMPLKHLLLKAWLKKKVT